MVLASCSSVARNKLKDRVSEAPALLHPKLGGLIVTQDSSLGGPLVLVKTLQDLKAAFLSMYALEAKMSRR